MRMKRFVFNTGFSYGLLREQLPHIFFNQGLAEKISLKIIALVVSQIIKLNLGLHPLGYDLEVQLMCQIDNVSYNDLFTILLDSVNKGFIYFQGINGKRLEIVQGSITSAEVIQRDLYSQAVQLLNDGYEFFGVGDKDGFGDFHLQIMAFKACLLQYLLNHGNKGGLHHLNNRYVDGYHRFKQTEPLQGYHFT